MAELGVVLFLFVIGLAMRPTKLWNPRGEIFGFGTAQVVTCSVLLAGIGPAARRRRGGRSGVRAVLDGGGGRGS